MTAHPYHRKLARVLSAMGGFYTPQDILSAIAAGRMQSFVEGESWAITQIAVFPRAKVLEILVALGDLDELRILHDRVLAYAGGDWRVGRFQAYGRRGWNPDTHGQAGVEGQGAVFPLSERYVDGREHHPAPHRALSSRLIRFRNG